MSHKLTVGKGTGRKSGSFLRATRAAVVAGLMFLAPAIASSAPISHKEVSVPRIDRRAIENLQRWVNGGHDDWCKDAREVAATELRRVAPEFSGGRLDLVSLLGAAEKSSTQAAFTWTSIDGSASYRVTVQRFAWLKPVAGKVSNEVWVPTRIEVTRKDQPASAKRHLAEIPKA
jgi:hypothetical protein